jgi:hypothetical protein
MRVDGLTKENEGEGETGKRVFTEKGKDGDGGKAVAHLGEGERSLLGDEREIAHDREAEAEAEGVALHFRDADQWRGPQSGFEIEDASRFTADGRRRAAGALASRAENVAARPNAQNAGAGL